MEHIIYCSAAQVSFDDAALKRLLGAARRFNTSVDVSGVLLFHKGTFLQVLEGEPAALDAVFARVQGDTRHRGMRILHRAALTQRQFSDWSMGWVPAEMAIALIPGLNDFFARGNVDSLASDAPIVRRLLDGFREGRYRALTEPRASGASKR